MKYHVPTKMLVIVLRNLMQFFTEESLYHQGFFAVKRRAVFILGACPKAVFYVFVFDSIHDSATMHHLCPDIFY